MFGRYTIGKREIKIIIEMMEFLVKLLDIALQGKVVSASKEDIIATRDNVIKNIGILESL